VSFDSAVDHARLAQHARRWGWVAYARYRVRAMRAYWQSMVGNGVILPILYLLAMGLGLGTLVDRHAGGVASVDYLVFVAPALLVSSLVMECTGEFTYAVMGNFEWHRIYFGVAATPVSPGQIAVGELAAVAGRLAAQGTAFYLILLVSGSTAAPWSWLMIPIGVLAALSFGAPLMAFSATREHDDASFAVVQRVIVMPMFLFAGTFFPLESLPLGLQWIGWASPMWHGTQLARAVSFGLPLSGWQVVAHLGFLVLLAGVGTRLAIAQYRRRLSR
jgi:lipooligosaccharide transport system permease protein